MPEKFVQIVGWVASVAAMLMFFSYIDQIRLNLQGSKGSLIQPAATVCNCLLWTTYGLFKHRRDWPIIAANVPGVVLGAFAFATAW